MSKRSEQTQLNIRPYKIEVYGLQDNYISTLQSYTDSFLGRVIEPKIKLMDDGTQTFTCKIPKFYIDPKTNQKIINPRWENEASVILAENTHVLKVFIQQGDNLKVFPFIVDKITDRRDSHFSVFKEVEANGLAFSDLGKVGYKLELNSHTLESDYEEDNTVVATIDYWLDKVFPNTKDSNGNIVSWNTPWCYEIKMDWSYFSSKRDSTKVYENSYTGSWIYDPNISPTELIPDGTVEGKEKARYIDCVNSNKYNITQTIAETFEVFCRYEYTCESNGKFVKEYTDENGKVWTGKKVVFYNKAIKTENPLVIDYQKNLDTITRTADSTDIYTKLFVVPVESVAMNDGYVTIASTQANPILDDFILNFDYLDSVGSISDYQKQFINEYKIQMRLINQELISLGEDIEVSTIDLNTLEAQSAFIKAQQSSLKEQLDYYQGLRDNEVINTPVTRGKDNSYSVVFVKDNVTGNLTASFHGLEGIDSDTIKGYKDYTYEEELFSSVEVASSISEVTKNEVVYALLGEDGFPASLVTKDGWDFPLGTVYIGLTYLPKNKYDKLVNSAQALLDQSAAELDDYENEETGKVVLAKAALEEKEQFYDDKLLEKAKLNEKFERILGPALREGNWQTDNYEDPKKNIVAIAGNDPEIENDIVKFIFDQEPFESEQKAYVLVGDALGEQNKYYFHYLKAEDFSFENNRLEDLIIRLRRDFTYTIPQNMDEDSLKIEFLKITVPFKGQRIVRYVKLDSPLKIDDKILLNYRGDTNNLYINGKQQAWYEGAAPNDETQVWDITQELAYHKENSDFYESLEGSLGEYFLYYGSGFKPAFYNVDGTNIPVLLIVGNSLLDIKDKTFDYEAYNFISYSFVGKPEVYDIGSLEDNLIKPNEKTHTLVYPRIHINAENVQYNSDLMTLKLTSNDGEASTDAPQLKKFEDYMVLSRKGQAYITLKVTQNNTFEYILSGPYRLDYQISHANEMLYLDAIQVAKDNSHPRYSYELKLANLPHEFAHVGLSEMVYINDHAMGIHAATGYISEVEYDLDEPQNDNIVIQNYKTKFEDLFHTITAQSEAMRKNSPRYDIAASGFAPNGSIAGSVLQQSLNNTQVYLDYSGTGVQITPQDGIILTNTQPYLNGVYGQIKLQGGGIFISSSVDENGNRIWSSSITPLGINANLLTAGQINTENIRIYSGDNMAFQWNPEGIFAYKNVEGELNPNVYVKYSQNGIHLIDNTLDSWNEKVYGEQALVSLDWNGLTLRNKEGQKTLFAEANTGNLMLSGTMQSFNYVPGLVGSGWQINQDGNAEFNNVKVRGTLSASVFEYDETTAVGGSIWVAPTIIITQDKTSGVSFRKRTSSSTWLYIEIPTPFKTISGGNILCGKEWKPWQEIWFNGKIVNKTNKEEIYEIKKLNMKISPLSFDIQDDVPVPNNTLHLTLPQELEENNYPLIFYNNDGSLVENEDNKNLWERILNDGFTGLGDWHLIFRGEENETEGILITAMEEGAPYIDIYDTNKQEDSDPIPKGAPKVRLGKLDGLKNINGIGTGGENALFPNIEGYGLYADNVYLRGAIYATSGRIGSLSIDEVEELSGTIDEITIKKDGQVIIKDGKVYADALATGSVVSGKISAGAIETGAIAAGSTLYLLSGGGTNYNLPPNYDAKSWIPYEGADELKWSDAGQYTARLEEGFSTIWKEGNYGSGVKIGNDGVFIRGTGKFEVNMKNFKVTPEGNVQVTGTITAQDGEIGGWTIDQSKLIGGSTTDGKEYYVGLASSGAYRIWAGSQEGDENSPFYVKSDGSIRATSGFIGGWAIQPDRLYAGSGDNYVALNTSTTSNSEYAIWAGDNNPTDAKFAVKKDGTVYLKKLIALGEPDEEGKQTETDVNLSNYPFWKLNYQVIKSHTANSITLSGGDTINFINAAASCQISQSWGNNILTQKVYFNTSGGAAGKEIQVTRGGTTTFDSEATALEYIVASKSIRIGITSGGSQVITGTVKATSAYNAGWNECIKNCTEITAWKIVESTPVTLYRLNGNQYVDVGSDWVKVSRLYGVYNIPDEIS